MKAKRGLTVAERVSVATELKCDREAADVMDDLVYSPRAEATIDVISLACSHYHSTNAPHAREYPACLL